MCFGTLPFSQGYKKYFCQLPLSSFFLMLASHLTICDYPFFKYPKYYPHIYFTKSSDYFTKEYLWLQSIRFLHLKEMSRFILKDLFLDNPVIF